MSTVGRRHPLVDALRARDGTLADRALRLIGEAHRVLEYTISTFSSGTDHTARHTTAVEHIGRMLLSDDFLAALADEELFLLALACHYHDLAMAGTEDDDRSTEAREQVRRDHAIRVGQIVLEKWSELGFDDERIARVLGEVCRGHRPNKVDGEANWDELNRVEILGPGTSVRVRLVSALIYAMDELHLGADRAPARVERWRDIQDEESRRHWRRHRAINGPALIAGDLLFQVAADTPGFEQDLRSQVFRKAFAAIRDLRRQAEADGVTSPLPTLAIEWGRKECLPALLALVASDLAARTRDDLEQELFARIDSELEDRELLTDLCSERGDSEADLRAAVRRCVGDAITSRDLVPSRGEGGKYELATDEMESDRIFRRMRGADELDRLFLGRYRAHWEEQLFDSPYGRAYVARVVLPVVERSYSVALATRAAEDPVRTILESCPGASRLILQFRPPTSNLVKSDLLGRAAIVGALFDLYADPDRLLDRRVRLAIRSLAGPDPAMDRILRLLEELALVGGLSNQQVLEAHAVSDATMKALDSHAPGEEESERVQLNLTQTVPGDVPEAATHLPRLLLAGRRASVPIQLANAPGHRLSIEMIPQGALSGPIGDTFLLEVGPAEVPHLGPARLPARFEVGRATRTIRFYFDRFDVIGPSKFPLVASLPVPPRDGGSPTARFGLSVHRPSVTIRDLRAMDAADQLIRSGRSRLEFLIGDQGELLASMKLDRIAAHLFETARFTGESIRGLRGLDGSLPAPHFVAVAEMARLGSLTESQRNAAWRSIRETPAENRPLVTSLFLRYLNDKGAVVDERFLRFLPGFPFRAPTLSPGGSMSQEEVDSKWDAGDDDFMITTFFEVDIPQASAALLEWCRSPQDAFPFRIGDGDVGSPFTRSRLAIRFLRQVDRVWHRERPVIFELGKVSRRESYGLEASYWRSIKDNRRADLADEIKSRMEEAPAAEGADALRPDRIGE